jgi:hypothetical protein
MKNPFGGDNQNLYRIASSWDGNCKTQEQCLLVETGRNEFLANRVENAFDGNGI